MNHPMMKRFLAVLFLLAPGLALADVKFSLKLHGGWAHIAGGDLNRGTQAYYDWAKIYFEPPSDGVIEGGFAAIHNGYEAGGDIVLELGRIAGVGVGASYLRMSSNIPEHWMDINHPPLNDGGLRYDISEATVLKALQLRLGIFLSLPVGRRLGFTADGGFSWYLGTRYHSDWYASQWHMTGLYPYQHFMTKAEKPTFPLGIHGGVGVEYRLLQRIGLFVEARGRYSRLKGLKGTSTSEPGEWGGLLPSFSESGKLYYEAVPTLPNTPRLIMVQSSPPNGPDGEPRQAVIDFSGVTLQVGIRIRL